MATVTINTDNLKNIIKDSLIEILTTRDDLIEIIEDIGLGKAMDQGKTGKYIDKKKFMKKLDQKIKES